MIRIDSLKYLKQTIASLNKKSKTATKTHNLDYRGSSEGDCSYCNYHFSNPAAELEVCEEGTKQERKRLKNKVADLKKLHDYLNSLTNDKREFLMKFTYTNMEY